MVSHFEHLLDRPVKLVYNEDSAWILGEPNEETKRWQRAIRGILSQADDKFIGITLDDGRSMSMRHECIVSLRELAKDENLFPQN